MIVTERFEQSSRFRKEARIRLDTPETGFGTLYRSVKGAKVAQPKGSPRFFDNLIVDEQYLLQRYLRRLGHRANASRVARFRSIKRLTRCAKSSVTPLEGTAR